MSLPTRSIRRPAAIVTGFALLAAIVTGFTSIPAHSLALDLSPFHRESLAGFHTDSFDPATPPKLQTNTATPQHLERHPRHRML